MRSLGAAVKRLIAIVLYLVVLTLLSGATFVMIAEGWEMVSHVIQNGRPADVDPLGFWLATIIGAPALVLLVGGAVFALCAWLGLGWNSVRIWTR